jgi:tryptophanyl-tRNA synthetase
MRMYTDRARTGPGVPGTVEGNPVFAYHAAFNDRPAEVADLAERYRSGAVGDVEVKQKLADAINRFLAPIQERRAAFGADEGLVAELIVAGTERARREVQRTVADMRDAMGLTAAFTEFRRQARRPHVPDIAPHVPDVRDRCEVDQHRK